MPSNPSKATDEDREKTLDRLLNLDDKQQAEVRAKWPADTRGIKDLDLDVRELKRITDLLETVEGFEEPPEAEKKISKKQQQRNDREQALKDLWEAHGYDDDSDGDLRGAVEAFATSSPILGGVPTVTQLKQVAKALDKLAEGALLIDIDDEGRVTVKKPRRGETITPAESETTPAEAAAQREALRTEAAAAKAASQEDDSETRHEASEEAAVSDIIEGALNEGEQAIENLAEALAPTDSRDLRGVMIVMHYPTHFVTRTISTETAAKILSQLKP